MLQELTFENKKTIAHIPWHPSLTFAVYENYPRRILTNHAFGMLSLYVRDVEKAKAFYTEFLGMKFIPEFSSPTFVFLQPTEGTPIAMQDLNALPPGESAQQGGFEINLEVEDVDAALQEWKAKGVEVLSEVTDMGAGRWFRAKDPAGHVLSVYQLYPQVKTMR